jgi:hypothetical protein
MGETSEELRREIEATRERMTETVDAIGYRADLKMRAKEAVVEKKDAVLDKAQTMVSRVAGTMPDTGAIAASVGDAGSSVASAVGDAVPSRQQVRRAVSVAQSNPLGLALGATAFGFLLGLVIPATRAEDQRFGELSDQVKEQARELGSQAVEHGKDLARETARQAGETMQQEGHEHAQDLARSLEDATREATTSGKDDA